MTIIEGNLRTENAKYGIVVARFNEFINAKLLSGALDAPKGHGAPGEKNCI
ncbi:6,7-dimethyl-8-ribityllumazine synthase [Lactococcus lactis]|nr:6,7-dimethyl-8-ribityllumazine synthase [Lactococcus lactis]